MNDRMKKIHQLGLYIQERKINKNETDILG
jgi:hypothetical protein